MAVWLARLRDWLRRERLDSELKEELRFHEALLERDGHVPASARRQLGNITRVREQSRDYWSIPWLDNLRQDLRYAFRGLNRSRGFAATVILTLGLGIGANAAMFGVIDKLMFRAFPYLRDPSSVNRVYLQTTVSGKTTVNTNLPYTRYLDFRRLTTSFSDYAGVAEWTLAIGEGQTSREHRVAGVSASFFRFFSASPASGRYFTTSEDSLPRGADVAVLSYACWQSEFGARNVIGEKLRIGPLLTTIIGVAPRDFVGVTIGEPPAVFLPITTLAYGMNQGDAQSFARAYGWTWMSTLVRRKAGVSPEAATADLTRAYSLSRNAQRALNPRTLPDSLAHPRAIAGSVKLAAGPGADLEAKTLLWVSGVALIVLLIACANVANLLLARMLKRKREIAMRLSLGASRSRLIVQFLTESLLLSALGCIAGIVIAQAVSGMLDRILIQGGEEVPVVTDWRTLSVACLCAIGAGLITGVGPALFAIRGDLSITLRADARSGTFTRSRLRSTLLVLQGALSVLLLVGAGEFILSLDNVRHLPLGWNPRGIVVATPNYRGMKFGEKEMDEFRRQLLAQARAIPGVAAAARINSMPFGTNTFSLFVPGLDSVERFGRFNYQGTSADFFSTLGTRVIRGRPFNDRDRADSPPVVVVSQSMASVLWPGQNAIDKCVRVGSDTAPCRTVIGIAEDVVQQNLSDNTRLMYYILDEQPPFHPVNRIFLRVASGDASRNMESIRIALQRIMPGEAYVKVTLLQTLVDTQQRSWMLGATLFVAFGFLALVVAGVGLYGVIGYTVTQRMHELGVRIALGAKASHIAWLVVAQGMSFAAAGAGLGVVASFLLAPWLEPLLFNQSARDPLVYLGVAFVLCTVSLGACVMPAIRAMRADPNEALRAD